MAYIMLFSEFGYKYHHCVIWLTVLLRWIRCYVWSDVVLVLGCPKGETKDAERRLGILQGSEEAFRAAGAEK